MLDRLDRDHRRERTGFERQAPHVGHLGLALLPRERERLHVDADAHAWSELLVGVPDPAAEIEGTRLSFTQCPGAAADPVARLDEQHVEPGGGELVRRRKPRGTGADDGNIDLGFETHGQELGRGFIGATPRGKHRGRTAESVSPAPGRASPEIALQVAC